MHSDDEISDLLPKLLRRARRLARTRDEAEDMAQETALRLWQVLREDSSVLAPERYAMIMLHNLARQRWRSRRVTEEVTDDMLQAAKTALQRTRSPVSCAGSAVYTNHFRCVDEAQNSHEY